MAEVVKGLSKMTLRVTSCSSDYKKASVRNALRLDVSRTHFCCGQHKSARYGFFAGDGRFMRLAEAEKSREGLKSNAGRTAYRASPEGMNSGIAVPMCRVGKSLLKLDLCQPVA